MAARTRKLVLVFFLFTLFHAARSLSSLDEFCYQHINPHAKEELYDFKLVSNTRFRRDAPKTSNVSDVIVPTVLTTYNTSLPASNVTTNATLSQPSIKTAVEVTNLNITKVSPNLTGGKNSTIELKLDHNLGENGTGIWHHKECDSGSSINSTSGKSTICVSEPIIPDKDQPNDTVLEYNSKEVSEQEETLFAEHNITQYKNDTHEYYNSTFITNKSAFDEYWKKMMSSGKMNINQILSTSHRRAATINLSFPFPFYGYIVKSVTIATGGFLYIGDHIHKWLAATQFIAPLMANFDTSLRNDSFVKYIDNGTSLTVIWENVTLQDKNHTDKFTFATTLQTNGDITFAYKNVPLPIESIHSEDHPVKVGLSDAFMVDRVFFLTRRKTIYEYHRVEFHNEPIKDNTLIHFTALPTCLQYDTCTSCLNHATAFQCTWCSSVGRCSHGNDRYRQTWIVKNCDETKISNISECFVLPNSTISNQNYSVVTSNTVHEVFNYTLQENNETKSTAVAFILTAVIIVMAVSAWLLYAYRNPHTYSGQLLIKYRPSQWGWRRGEARYTAATIHM